MRRRTIVLDGRAASSIPFGRPSGRHSAGRLECLVGNGARPVGRQTWRSRRDWHACGPSRSSRSACGPWSAP
eukprot:15483652-Alexandrium_andersonii.AAC.1